MHRSWRDRIRSLKEKGVHWLLLGVLIFAFGAAFVVSTLPKSRSGLADGILPFSSPPDHPPGRWSRPVEPRSGLAMLHNEEARRTDQERAQDAGEEIFGAASDKDKVDTAADQKEDAKDPIKELEESVDQAEKRLDQFERGQRLDPAGFGSPSGRAEGASGSDVMLTDGDEAAAADSPDGAREPFSGRQKSAIARGNSPGQNRQLTSARGRSGGGSQFAAVGGGAGGRGFGAAATGAGVSIGEAGGVSAAGAGADGAGASGAGMSSELGGASTGSGGVSAGDGGGERGSTGGGDKPPPTIGGTTVAPPDGNAPVDCDTLWQQCKTLLGDYDRLIDDASSQMNGCTVTRPTGKYGQITEVDQACFNRVTQQTKDYKNQRWETRKKCQSEYYNCVDNE